MHALWSDFGLSARSLARRWGFALVGALTLALGIGATTAVFSVVNGVLLRPLPYTAAERIGIIWHDLGRGAQSLPAVSFHDYLDYRERARRFEDWTIATGWRTVLGTEDDPRVVDVGMVAANFFEFFGYEPLLGRAFACEEDVVGGPAIVILSHRLWQSQFGGDPEIIGRGVDLNGSRQKVVGVLPEDFRLLLPAETFRLRDADLFMPVRLDHSDQEERNLTEHTVFARLAPGVSWGEAQKEMERLEAQLKEEHAEHAAADLQVRVVPLHTDVVKGARTSLWILLAAVGLVMLVACGNLSQLLLTRWRGGSRELALRAALGASRPRLLRLVLIESLLLALLGALLGLAFAYLGVELVRHFGAASVPRLEDVGIDPTALWMTVGTALLSALLFSLLPMAWLSRVEIAAELSEGNRGSASTSRVRSRDLLIAAEVALSVVLLVATGLMIRSFTALQAVEPGFTPQQRLTFRLSLPGYELGRGEEVGAALEDLRGRLLAQPGVRALAYTSQLPLTGSGPMQPFAYDADTARNWESVSADHRWVTPGYFDAIGATLLEGRDFVPDDVRLRGRVIIIDDLLAQKAFPGVSPIGRQLQVEPDGSEEPTKEVVGVVRHLRLHDLTRSVFPEIFSPFGPWMSFDVVLYAEVDPWTLVDPVTELVRSLHPGAAIDRVRPMSELVRGAMAQARLSLILMTVFGAMALLLAAIGLFGVISFAVRQRTIEFGIRIAMGASPAGIGRIVLGRGGLLVLAGTLLGLIGAAVASQSLSGLLFGVEPFDPGTYLAVSVVLGAVALLACWLPARRATRLDVVQALKTE